jgi:hypothetical protein
LVGHAIKIDATTLSPVYGTVSALHLADHYFRYYQRNNEEFSKRYKHIGQFQTVLRSKTPSFKVIQDMANAYKHLYTRASCSVASGGSIESLTYGNQTIETNWQEENGKWTANIVIRRRDKSVVGFAGAIQEIIEMWSALVIGDSTRGSRARRRSKKMRPKGPCSRALMG